MYPQLTAEQQEYVERGGRCEAASWHERARRACAGPAVALDIALAVLSYEFAVLVVRLGPRHRAALLARALGLGVPGRRRSPSCVTFVWLGLYKLEAYVSRPLHVLTLAKGDG